MSSAIRSMIQSALCWWLILGGEVDRGAVADLHLGAPGQRLAPLGRALSLPHTPTGTIGAPERRAISPTPGSARCRVASGLRVPSGIMISTRPWASTASERRIASRSAVWRATGKAL